MYAELSVLKVEANIFRKNITGESWPRKFHEFYNKVIADLELVFIYVNVIHEFSEIIDHVYQLPCSYGIRKFRYGAIGLHQYLCFFNDVNICLVNDMRTYYTTERNPRFIGLVL